MKPLKLKNQKFTPRNTNGSRGIVIPKTYFDDGILDDNKTYSITITEEESKSQSYNDGDTEK